jgi:hypothetical protein
MYFLAKYNTQTDIRFAMVKRGVVDLAATADWTPATGDTKISKDGGSVANTTNNPSAVAGTGSITWKLTLTAAELSAAEINIQIVDSATKAVEDQFLTIYTYGNAAAKHPIDLSTVIENQVWDALRSAHIATGSMGQSGASISRDGTAQAGAAGSITLDASASATNDFYKGSVVYIYTGTGAGQSPRTISGYVGATKVASVSPNWTTTPDATSKFIIWTVDDPAIVGSDSKTLLSTDTQSGVTIPTVTTLTNAPADSASLTAIKTVTDALMYKKNTALANFEFVMTDSTTHLAKTGLVNGDFTKTESIDGAAFAALSGTIAEVGNGVYKISLTSGEMNGGFITLRFVASGADDTLVSIKTNL